MARNSKKPILFCFLLLILNCSGFSVLQRATLSRADKHALSQPSLTVTGREPSVVKYGSTCSKLSMAQDEEGPGILVSTGILLIMILFVATGLMPMLDGGGRDLSIADSVVTRQDAPGKLENFESKQDRLSRATIQEKLSAVPVFYISEGGTMKTDIYVSYTDATAEAAKFGGGSSVKATSLDQVMYVMLRV